MANFSPLRIREYELTDQQRRDRRALLALCLVSVMDIYTSIVQHITLLGVEVDQAIPANYRNLIYAVAISYFVLAVGIRRASQWFGDSANEFEQNQHSIRQRIEADIDRENPMNVGHPDQDEYGIQSAIERRLKADKRAHRVTLWLRTLLDSVGPVLIGIWTIGLNISYWCIASSSTT